MWTQRGFLALVLLCGSCGSPPEDDAAAMAEYETLAEERENLEAAVTEELTELEKRVGDLREDADETAEDFSAEFVHVDELMKSLADRLETADIDNARDLERLRSETNQALVDIKDAVSGLEVRIAGAATGETNPTDDT